MKKQHSYQILAKAFESKKKKSTGFSIRLVAQKIGISHSYLSRVLQGKKGLASAHLNHLCTLLEIDDVTKILLEKALITEGSEKRGLTSAAGLLNARVGIRALERYDEVRDKDFSLYDQWYFVPLMDLVAVEGFKNEPTWIAKKLGITKDEAKGAITILLQSGHLKETAKGLKKTNRVVRVPTVKSIAKIRTYHKQMILKSLEELETKTDEASFQKRLISGICISVNPENIPKAQQILQDALHEAASVLLEGKATDLYHLNVQLFSLLK